MNRNIIEIQKETRNYRLTGEQLGISKQRVEQLLRPYKEQLKEYIGRSAKPYTTIKCDTCNKEQVSTYRYYTPKHCKQCRQYKKRKQN